MITWKVTYKPYAQQVGAWEFKVGEFTDRSCLDLKINSYYKGPIPIPSLSQIPLVFTHDIGCVTQIYRTHINQRSHTPYTLLVKNLFLFSLDAPSTEPKGKPTAELTTTLTTSRESISTKPESWTAPGTTTITTEAESQPETAHTPEPTTVEPTTEPEPTIIDEEFWP